MNEPSAIEVEFWKRVQKGSASSCWTWTGAIECSGYGRIKSAGKTSQAHRLSWHLHKGKIPPDKCVLHRCDNRLCVNPKHLFLGTHADNVADMVRKGRQARGERQHLARLTPKKVRAIRALWATDRLSQREIAAKFGVVQRTVAQIIHRLTWSHID